jgi:hypothetical protein
LSHYSGEKIDRALLKWQRSDGYSGNSSIKKVKKGEVTEIIKLNLPPVEVKTNTKIRIDFSLESESGNILAENYFIYFVFPDIVENELPVYNLYDPFNSINLIEREYQIRPKVNNKREILVTNQIDDFVIQKLINGASVICVIDSTSSINVNFPFDIINRDTEWYDGNWASNLNWLNDYSIPMKSVSFGKSFGFEAAAAPMQYVMNTPPKNNDNILAGMYIGWVHLTSAYIVQMNAGSGRLIVSGINFLENLDDSFSQSLFSSLLYYINSENCTPTFTWDIK